MSRLLLILALLSNIALSDDAPGLPGDDIWVYVESDPHPESAQVLDALDTPIEVLRARHPDNQAIQDYITQLDVLRQELYNICDVKIIRRDDINLSSLISLPAYCFNDRDNPNPLPKEVYLHWQLIPDYLRYLSRISFKGKLATNPNYACWLLGVNYKANNPSWLRSSLKGQDYLRIVGGIPVLCEYRISQLYPAIEPPAICPDIDWPYIVTTKATAEVGPYKLYSESKLQSNCSPEKYTEILSILDFGTGIIQTQTSEESTSDP